jgi:hypothetical protein
MSRALLLPLIALACSGGPGPKGATATDDTAPGGDSGRALDTADTGEPPGPDPAGAYLVVTTAALAPVAEELAAYRAELGFSPEVIALADLPAETDALLEAVQAHVLAAADPELPTYLVLLGDAGEPVDDRIPAIACENDHGQCYTDNRYADVDGDRIPDAAVGRIPAQSVEQARAYVAKLQRHEQETLPGPWNRRFVLYASQAGFGPEIEIVLEYVMLEGLAAVDPAFEIIGLYDNPRSVFYYTPFEEKVEALYNAGSVLTMYVGHGSADETEGLSVETLDAISCEDRMPIVAFFACNNGRYAGEQDSLAEAVLWKADGPIAAFAGTGVTHPYANAVGPYEFQRAMFSGAHTTLGPAVVAAKRAAFEPTEDPIRTLIDAYAIIYELDDQADELLRQSLDLYNLMGDPAVSLGLPDGRATVDVTAGSVSAGALSISGTTPGIETGRATVSLEVPRNVVLNEPDEIDSENPDPAVVQANWVRTIDTRVVETQVGVVDGAFVAELAFDGDLPGDTFYVKVYAEDGENDAFGFAVAP